MPFMFDKLDCRCTAKIPQLQNLRQKEQLQVTLLQMSLELGNGQENVDPNPGAENGILNLRLTFGGMPRPSFGAACRKSCAISQQQYYTTTIGIH